MIPRPTSPGQAFTLIELLLVIAIIAIMASLVISAFSNASADSRLVLAGQQQAVVQEAINSWVAHETAPPRSIAQAQQTYNAATTGAARLLLARPYLDDATYQNFDVSNANQLRTDAMSKTGKYLQITSWTSGSYPKVHLLP